MKGDLDDWLATIAFGAIMLTPLWGPYWMKFILEITQ